MVDNKRCIGCGACAEICPHGCITMQQDRYGFFKPVADPAECVRCGLCDRCCPAENRQKKNGVSGAFAAQNKDDSVVRSSSSGGVFSALAGAILKAGGAVYGVELDPSMQPVHTRIDDQKELYRLQGSKYVQSDTRGAFSNIRRDLKNGLQVLFSGTPCQVAALRAYLGNEYENLYTMDLICHGASSPLAWKAYLQQRERNAGGKASGASFRSKELGWRRFSMNLSFSNGKQYCKDLYNDTFLRAFLANLFLNDACANCSFKGTDRESDLTAADFWGVEEAEPSFFDDKGISLVLTHTVKGEKLLQQAENDLRLLPVAPERALEKNTAATTSVSHHRNREKFFYMLQAGTPFDKAVQKCLNRSFLSRIKTKMKKALGAINGKQ